MDWSRPGNASAIACWNDCSPISWSTMPVVTADSIILQVFPYGETSRILRLLTATHGLQSAIAKGARRPRSRYGLLEPFCEGVVTLHVRETRELQTLTGFELTRTRTSLGADLMRFGGASLLAEIVLRATGEEAQPGLFESVIHAFERLQTEPRANVEAAILSEAWRLIATLGFAPELDDCLDCGAPVPAGADVKFDYAAGGIRCGDCAAGAPGREIPARARLALQQMANGATPTIERTAGHWWLLSRYLDHHVLEGSSLHSLAFLAATRDGDPCVD
jgi:DNA repair protein RecO (recombination protein O)